ncbi:hypothetical protein PCASD_19722 [Puccinia coronata f. sp. avenae]|uniref:Uncharacterized protein n=1 Tax=Puccinia coronata f. sp. avenae TaxID=200324 RepID=A0A2N5SRK5_9BASI|nr:hypothetical protein PCASD_19722 [Puccinia coronata f. sp. avenae]
MPPTRRQQRLSKSGTTSTSSSQNPPKSLVVSSQNPPKNLVDDKPATSGVLRPLTDKEELLQAQKVAQNAISGIIRPFRTHKKKSTGINTSLVDPISSSDEEDNAEGQIEILAHGEEPAVLSDDNSSDGDSVGQADQHNLESLVEEDIQNGSDEDEGDTYTSASCKQSLAKFREIAKKL